MADSFEESDLRAGLKDGGQLLGAFIVARSEEEFVVYLRPSWGRRGRGFRIVRTWRGACGDRTFKSLQSAWCFVRKFDFFGRVTVYPAGDLELHQFVGVITQDLEASPRLAGPEQTPHLSSLPDSVQPPGMVAVPDLVAAVHQPVPGGAALGPNSPISAKPLDSSQ